MSEIRQAADLLRRFNAWRCGSETIEAPEPAEVTRAIALVCSAIHSDRIPEVAADANAQLNAMRRLLDEARTTLVGIATVTPKYWELPRDQFIDEFLPWAQSRARDTAAKIAAAKIAAPVPAQPARGE